MVVRACQDGVVNPVRRVIVVRTDPMVLLEFLEHLGSQAGVALWGSAGIAGLVANLVILGSQGRDMLAP